MQSLRTHTHTHTQTYTYTYIHTHTHATKGPYVRDVNNVCAHLSNTLRLLPSPLLQAKATQVGVASTCMCLSVCRLCIINLFAMILMHSRALCCRWHACLCRWCRQREEREMQLCCCCSIDQWVTQILLAGDRLGGWIGLKTRWPLSLMTHPNGLRRSD